MNSPDKPLAAKLVYGSHEVEIDLVSALEFLTDYDGMITEDTESFILELASAPSSKVRKGVAELDNMTRPIFDALINDPIRSVRKSLISNASAGQYLMDSHIQFLIDDGDPDLPCMFCNYFDELPVSSEMKKRFREYVLNHTDPVIRGYSAQLKNLEPHEHEKLKNDPDPYVRNRYLQSYGDGDEEE